MPQGIATLQILHPNLQLRNIPGGTW